MVYDGLLQSVKKASEIILSNITMMNIGEISPRLLPMTQGVGLTSPF